MDKLKADTHRVAAGKLNGKQKPKADVKHDHFESLNPEVRKKAPSVERGPFHFRSRRQTHNSESGIGVI
jgi:hypothetical protein